LSECHPRVLGTRTRRRADDSLVLVGSGKHPMNEDNQLNAVAVVFSEVVTSVGALTIPIRAARPKIELVERSPRSMNNMDAETKLIHARLEEWSKATKRYMEARGYPRESHYHKWALLGIAPNPGHEAPLPDREAHVDTAVTKLGAIDRSVIWRFYMEWRPVKIWERIPGVASEHKFNVVLKRARWRVDGYLSAIEAR
jgi:hypothetical protein